MIGHTGEKPHKRSIYNKKIFFKCKSSLTDTFINHTREKQPPVFFLYVARGLPLHTYLYRYIITHRAHIYKSCYVLYCHVTR